MSLTPPLLISNLAPINRGGNEYEFGSSRLSCTVVLEDVLQSQQTTSL